jgi:hypothetical protein
MNSLSGAGSRIAIAPERRFGLGFSGARTGTSGSPRTGGSLAGRLRLLFSIRQNTSASNAPTISSSSFVRRLSLSAFRFRLSRPLPISTVTTSVAAKARQDLCRARSWPNAPGACGSCPARPSSRRREWRRSGSRRLPDRRFDPQSRASTPPQANDCRPTANDQRRFFWWS